MTSTFRVLVGWLALAALAAGQSCPPNGLVLSATGGRLGDPYRIALAGAPGAAGLLGLDLAGGPTPTPIGTVCLGLTQALTTLPFTLDAAGGFGISGLLAPIPSLAGIDVFLQAAAADASQPSGYAISNGVKVGLRPPRLFVLWAGFYMPFNVTAGSWVVLDALSNTFGPVHPLPTHVRDAVTIPDLGWIAFLLLDGTIAVHDGSTGALVLGITPAPAPNLSATARLAVRGTTLILTEFLNQSFATLRTFQLPAGTPGFTVALPSSSTELVLVPGTGFAYAIGESSPLVVPVDLVAGNTLPPINAGIGQWIAGGGILYGLFVVSGGGQALNAIDPSTNTTLFPAPVAIPAALPSCCGDRLFRYGTGSTGPSVFVRDFATSSLMEFSPQTFALSAPPIPIPPATSTMGATNGGTEWILVVNPPCFATGTCGAVFLKTALALNSVTHAITTVGVFSTGYSDEVLSVRSFSVNKAFLAAPGYAPALTPIDTDPTTILQPALPLPLPYVVLRYLLD